MKVLIIIALLFCSSFVYAEDYDCEDGSFLPEDSGEPKYDHSIGGWTFENVDPQFSSEYDKDQLTIPVPESAPQCTSCEDHSDELKGGTNEGSVE